MDEAQQIPLSAVPILLQIIAQPDHASRDDTLALLCDLVAGSYGEDGDAIGAVIRESGGLSRDRIRNTRTHGSITYRS